MCSVLQDLEVDSFVVELFVFNFVPVDGRLLVGWQVDQAELSVVAHVGDPPLVVPLEVILESLLTVNVTVGHLEDLLEQVLLLLGHEQGDLGLLNLLLEDVLRIFREIQVLKLLLLNLGLFHVDDLGEEVVVLESGV